MKKVIAVIMMASAVFAEDVVYYKDLKLVEDTLWSSKDIKTGWDSVARGGSSTFWSSYTTFNGNGGVMSSSWTSYSKKRGGAVLAVPIGDFQIRDKFRYRGANENGVKKDLDGLLVEVKVQVSSGGDTVNQLACQKAVENMVKIGVSMSKGVGCKPMRYCPLTETAKKRFGARIVRIRYCGNKSAVQLLLLDCNQKHADETFLPATPHALTRDGRLALVKELKPNKDKGFTSIGSSETEEHPIGSPHKPDGKEWKHNGKKHTKTTNFDSRRKKGE